MTTNDPGKTHHAEKELSQLYQSLRTAEPEATTDEAILNFARQRVLVKQSVSSGARINWTGGFSVAASILTVSVIYWTQFSSHNLESPEASFAPEIVSLTDPVSASGTSVLAKSPAEIQSTPLAKLAQRQAQQKTVASVTEDATIASSVTQVEIAALGISKEEGTKASQATSQQAEQMDTFTEETLVDPSQILVTGLRPKNVNLIPDCQVTIHGGYAISNTPLGSHVESWSSDEKAWLIEQLNNFKPLAMVVETWPGENPGVLKRSGFEKAYAQTLESLKHCKTPTEPAQR